MVSTVIGTAIGVIVGGVITVMVTHLYYVRASRDLASASSDLRHLVELLMLQQEQVHPEHPFAQDDGGRRTGVQSTRTASPVTAALSSPRVRPAVRDEDKG